MQFDSQAPQTTYDPRWFIWTIVFLVSTGVMLVTYITTTSANDNAEVVTTTNTLHRSK
jgi:hypothetical protein